jgi:release factor glutamine methyltransferase
MQLREALAQAVRRLEENDVGSPRMNAEVLLMFVLNCDRAYLYAHPERELTPDETRRYDEALETRSTGVPAQYITGHQEFWGLDFIVNPAVLIPRPETEHVIETVVPLARDVERPRIVDVGTGSGCIAIALAHELPQADITAVDLSSEALEVARLNATRLRVESRIRFAESDLLSGVTGEEFDFVVSNPPYVGEFEADRVQREVRKYEPHMAVFGGEKGLDIVQRLVGEASSVLREGGWLVVEIGFTQSHDVLEMVRNWNEARAVPDLQGIPRVIAAKK